MISFAQMNEPRSAYPFTELNSGINQGIIDRYKGFYLPCGVHIISEISALGNEIRFEDGSVWRVSPHDCEKVMQWLTAGIDPNIPVYVSVMQNTSWFSDCDFRLVNRNTGSSIVANLFQGPWQGGEKTLYVEEIDFDRGIVKLSSGNEITRWEICPSDLYKLREWDFNDFLPVILGHNAKYNSCWNPYWESLLINVRKTKSFVQAHQR